MRLNTIITLGASGAFGLMAVFLARGWINNALQDEFAQARPASAAYEQPSVPLFPVLVANADLVFGDEVTPEILRIVELPEDTAPLAAYTDFSQLFRAGDDGRIIALASIAMNETILPHKVSGPDGRGSLSARIRPGYRAVSVRVDDVTGVAGFVVPGDLIDIVYTYEPNPDAKVAVFRSDILLQSVKILGVDQMQSDTTEGASVARTVTLEVNHLDAQALSAAQEVGTISLILRSAGETQPTTSAPVMSSNLSRRQQVTPKRPRKARAKTKAKPVDPVRHAEILVRRGETTETVAVLREDIPQAYSQKPPTSELAGGL